MLYWSTQLAITTRASSGQLVHPLDQAQLILRGQPLVALRRAMLPHNPAGPTLRHPFEPNQEAHGIATARRAHQAGLTSFTAEDRTTGYVGAQAGRSS